MHTSTKNTLNGQVKKMVPEFLDLKTFCNYCKHELPQENFKSEWNSHVHYKTQTCPHCSRDVRIVVDFESDGHDTWNGIDKFKTSKENGKIRTLEEKIKIVKEIEMRT